MEVDKEDQGGSQRKKLKEVGGKLKIRTLNIQKGWRRKLPEILVGEKVAGLLVLAGTFCHTV